MEDVEVCPLASRTWSLAFSSVYSMVVLYLALHRVDLAVVDLFPDFAPIQIYNKKETTHIIPT